MHKHNRLIGPLLLAALLLALPAGLVQADVPHSNIRDSVYMIYQFPASYDPWEEWDEPLMSQWNTFASVMTWSSSPSGTFGPGNGKNEYAGFLTNSQMDQYYGWTWGGAAAVTMLYGWNGKLYETDIAWNSHLSWTTDVQTTVDDPNQLMYQQATIHELGHTFGLDDYDYDKGGADKAIGYDTVMNYAHPWHNFALGLDDAMTIQKMYPGRMSNVHDVGIYDYYCTSQYSCPDASKSTGQVSRGGAFELTGIQIANLGNFSEADVSAMFYLSGDVYIDSNDLALGSISFGSLASRTRSIVDVELTVPGDADNGTYYVGAVIGGVAADALAQNNSMFLPSPIKVGSGSGDDDDDDDNDPDECEDFCEIIDKCGLAGDLGIGTWDACLALCDDVRSSVLECVLNATTCSEVTDCVGLGGDDDDDDDDSSCGL